MPCRHVTSLFVTLLTCCSCIHEPLCSAKWMLNEVKSWKTNELNTSQRGVSDSVVKKTCWVLLVLICGTYTSCVICTAKAVETKAASLWCFCGDSGQTHLVWWEQKINQSYPLTIWPYMSFIFHAACTRLLSGGSSNTRAPNVVIVQDANVLLQISIGTDGREQPSRSRKNVIITYFWWIYKTANKVCFDFSEKQQKWSNGYGVDLRGKKKCDLLKIQVCVVSVLLTFHRYLESAPMHALHIGLTCGM